MKNIIVFLSLFISVAAQGGVVMVSDQTMDFRGQPMKQQAKAYLDQDKSRVDMLGGMMGDRVMIFRKDKGVMWMIDTKQNTYTETSMSDLARDTVQLEEKAKQMRERMAAQGIKLPPTPPPSVKPTYQKVGSGEKVGGWTCDHYEGTANGKKTQDIWTASPSEVGLSNADYQVMKNLGDSMKNSKSTSSMPFFGEGGLEGVPVKFVYYSPSGGTITNELREIYRQETHASLFELPSTARKVPALELPTLKK